MAAQSECGALFFPDFHGLTLNCLCIPLIPGGNDHGDKSCELRALFCYCILVKKTEGEIL
jgi:hypothetical protein